MQHEVFISYHRNSSAELVEHIVAALESHGIKAGAKLLESFMPETSEKILAQLGDIFIYEQRYARRPDQCTDGFRTGRDHGGNVSTAFIRGSLYRLPSLYQKCMGSPAIGSFHSL